MDVRILILEDSDSDAELMLDALRDMQPFDYHIARDEQGFLDVLGGHFDVILADYNLRDFNALLALNVLAFRGLAATLPLIVVTGALGSLARQTCMQLGAAAFLSKNQLSELPAAIAYSQQGWKLR